MKSEKKNIYFLLATEPLIFILILKEFLISTKIIVKKINNKIPFEINSAWRLKSFNLIKLLSINVKNVIKPIIRVIKNIVTINRFLFNKVNIN